jgi:hypothetical protein
MGNRNILNLKLIDISLRIVVITFILIISYFIFATRIGEFKLSEFYRYSQNLREILLMGEAEFHPSSNLLVQQTQSENSEPIHFLIPKSQEVIPGNQLMYTFILQNDIDTLSSDSSVLSDTFMISVTSEVDTNPVIIGDPKRTVDRNGGAIEIQVKITVPFDTKQNVDQLTITATSVKNNEPIIVSGTVITQIIRPDYLLNMLSLHTGVLSPSFHATTFQYEVQVNDPRGDINELTIKISRFGESKIVVNGIPMAQEQDVISVPIGNNQTQIEMTVTSHDGITQKSYLLQIYKIQLGLNLLNNNIGAISPSFNKSIDSYRIEVPVQSDRIVFTPKVSEEDPNATTYISSNGLTQKLLSGLPNVTVRLLRFISNQVLVTYKSPKFGYQRTYTLNINRSQITIPEEKNNNTIELPPPDNKVNSSPISYSETPSDTVITLVDDSEKTTYPPLCVSSINMTPVKSTEITAGWKDLQYQIDEQFIQQAQVISTSPEGKSIHYTFHVVNEKVASLQVKLTRKALQEAISKADQLVIHYEYLSLSLPMQTLGSQDKEVILTFRPMRNLTDMQSLTNTIQQRFTNDSNKPTFQLLEKMIPIALESNLPDVDLLLNINLDNQLIPEPPIEKKRIIDRLSLYYENINYEKKAIAGNIMNSECGVAIQYQIKPFRQIAILQKSDLTSTKLRYIQGYPDQTFKPFSLIKRSEVATILSRLAIKKWTTTKPDYADVPQSYWAYHSIKSLSNEGVMQADDGNVFSPERELTRGEMAEILVKWLDLSETVSTNLTDIAGNIHQIAIEKVFSAGYMIGDAARTFRPNDKINRAEFVTMMNRITGISPLKNSLTTSSWKDVSADFWAFGSIEAASK